MTLTIENNQLVITEKISTHISHEVVRVDAYKLAKLLKPYIDSIPNCECKKEMTK